MSDKKTIQEALAEVQRNAELKRIEEAKAVWGESLDLNEFKFPKFKTPKFEPKPTKPMPHGGEKLTPETPKGKRGPEEINIKPDTSTGKTKIEPAKPAEAPKTGGLGSKILGFGLGAALGTVVGDKLANKMKDAEPAKNDAPAEPEKPKDSPKSDDMTFGQAFAAARKAATEKGAKSTGQFSWHGKDYQTNIQGKGTPKAPEEKYVAPSKQTKVDIGTKASAPAAKPETPSTPQGFQGSTKDTTPIGPDPTKFSKPTDFNPEPEQPAAKRDFNPEPEQPAAKRDFNPEPEQRESGGKKKKMSEEINPMIAAFLKLQESNPQNMFEAAKKAKKDYDKDGKIESPKDEVWGSRFAAAKKAGKMEETNMDPVVTGSSSVTKSKTGYVDPSTPTEPYKKAPMSTGAGDVLNKASDAVFNKKGIKEAYMAVLEAKKAKAKTRTEDGYGYDRYGNLKNPEDRYDDNNERIVPQNRRDSSSDEANDIIKGSAPMQGLRKSGGYDAGEVNDPGGRRSNEINDIIRGGAPIKGLRHSGGYDAGEVNDPGGRRSNEINDIIRGAAPIKGLQRSGGYNGSDASSEKSSGNGSEGRSSASWPPPKERPKNIPKDEYEYFPGMKKDPKGLSYRAVDEAKKTRTEDGAPIQGLRHSGGYDAGEVNDPGGRKSGEINSIIQGGAPIRGLHHSGGYDAVQRGEHLYKYNLRTGEKIPGGNAEMPAGWTPPASGKSNWDKSKEWEPTPTTDEKQAEKDRKWEALKKTLKPLPKDVPEEVEFSQAEIDHLNSFFLEASVAPNRPEVATGADSVSDKMSHNDVTGTSTESGGKKKVKEETDAADETNMAKTQLKAMSSKAMNLHSKLKTSKNLPAWVQSKLAVAKDGVTAVDDYMTHSGKIKEDIELEEGDLTIRTLYNKWAGHASGYHEKSGAKANAVEKAITKVHGPKVMSHLKKALNANLQGNFDKENSHFEKARTAAGKSEMIGATVGSGRSEFRKTNEETLQEAGMPSSVIAQKQKLANMSDEEFAEKHGNKSEKELRDMAARHGYGWDKATKTGSDHYVKRVASIAMKEETLEEGRPKKNPTPETTERDPRKHIQVEAGRAAAGNVIDFHHNDGTKSKITPAMGRRITSHLNSLKPADRQSAVNKMHDSAEGLKV